MHARPLAWSILALAALVPQASLAEGDLPPAPLDLAATFDGMTASLSWTQPAEGDWTYRVYRAQEAVGKGPEPWFQDQPPPDVVAVYFVTASPDGASWSLPAVAAISLVAGCEVVSASTSFNYPFVHVHVHEECLDGITYDRDVTWTAE